MTAVYPPAPVLIVDDEENILQSLSIILSVAGINNTVLCQDSRKVKLLLSQHEFSAITLDLTMPHISGQELLSHMITNYPEAPVIVLTASNELETAVACMKSGAFDYLLKPIDKTRLVTCVRHAIESWEIKNENAILKEHFLSDRVKQPEAFASIISQSSQIQSIFRYVEAIAATSLPVLITGETGVGKELLARAIHAVSSGRTACQKTMCRPNRRRSRPRIKGSYTGATTDREGVLGKASAGTLFLDEIGDLAVESQIKLLRLLQEKEYYPLGSDRSQLTDARLIFATNHDLRKAVVKGEFRKDLYYRLHSHNIHVPPLRERKDDIPLLTDHFLEKAAGEMAKKKPTPPRELCSLLKAYHFPGNVRELEGLVYNAVVRHESGILSEEDMANVEEDYQVCVRMLARTRVEKKFKTKGRKKKSVK